MRHNTKTGRTGGGDGMEMTRRRFATLLQAGAAMAVAGECAAVGSETVTLLNRQSFAPLEGTVFPASAPSGERFSLTLREVRDITIPDQPGPRLECSLLRFSVQGRKLREGTYQLVHSTAGEFRLHLSPGNSGYCLAFLTHLPAEYLNSISIPRKAPARTA